MKRKKMFGETARDAELSTELKPDASILIYQNKCLASQCKDKRKEIEEIKYSLDKLRNENTMLNRLVASLIGMAAHLADSIGEELPGAADSSKWINGGILESALATVADEFLDHREEEGKDKGINAIPAQPIESVKEYLHQVSDIGQGLKEKQQRCLEKKYGNKIEAMDDIKKQKEERVEASRVIDKKLPKIKSELSFAKAAQKRLEDEGKEKDTRIEELEFKISKLQRRIQSNPLAPYAVTERTFFSKSSPPHECICIVCGKKAKLRSTSSSGDSPEHTLVNETAEHLACPTEESKDFHSNELFNKVKHLEMEAKILTTENLELKKVIAEKIEVPVLSQQLFLESETFNNLLKQAEYICKKYGDLKQKHSKLKQSFHDLSVKYENELKTIAANEEKKISDILGEVANILSTKNITDSFVTEQNRFAIEAEKHLKSTISLQQEQIAKLETDLCHINKLLDTFKSDPHSHGEKDSAISSDLIISQVSDILSSVGASGSECLEHFRSFVSSVEKDLQSEKQMAETWLSEIEVTSKAYELEKNKSKQLYQQIDELNQKIVMQMTEAIKESKQRAALEDQKQHALKKIAILEKEVAELKELRNLNDLDVQKHKELYKTLLSENEEKSRAIKEMETILQKVDARNEDLKHELEQEKKNLEEWKIKFAKCNSSNLLSSKVERLMSDPGQKDGEEDVKLLRAALEHYKEMLRCKVCNTRTKEVVINRCCHMFCKECINTNLHMRRRYCPTCREKFSRDDLKPVWWDS